MHSGVYTVSSVKSSAAIGGSEVKGAHAAPHIHILRTPAFGTQQPAVALPFPSSSPPLFSASHLLSMAQLAALTPVSWLTSCSRRLIKKSWLLGFRGCFPINMNSPRSSCNIRPSPVFIQPATRSFLRDTQEEMKRVNSPFKMLHSVKGGTEPPVNGTSIVGFKSTFASHPRLQRCGLCHRLLKKKKSETRLYCHSLLKDLSI